MTKDERIAGGAGALTAGMSAANVAKQKRAPACPSCPERHPIPGPCRPPSLRGVHDDAMNRAAVNHPPHYRSHPSGVEAIDICEWLPYNIGNTLKYLWRAGHKGDSAQDRAKASWYLRREADRRERGGILLRLLRSARIRRLWDGIFAGRAPGGSRHLALAKSAMQAEPDGTALAAMLRVICNLAEGNPGCLRSLADGIESGAMK